jgi:hypothetical protein
VKIKDIVNEGILSGAKDFALGFGKAITPRALKPVIDASKGSMDPTETELAAAAYKQFGEVPDEQGKATNYGEYGWLTPEEIERRLAAVKAEKQAKKSDAEKIAKKTAAAAKAASQKTAPQKSSAETDSPAYGAGPGQKVPGGQRIAVTNPQGNATFYKYPDGRWTDEYGTIMPAAAHGALDQYADTRGRMEAIPTQSKTGTFRTKRGSRAK